MLAELRGDQYMHFQLCKALSPAALIRCRLIQAAALETSDSAWEIAGVYVLFLVFC